MRDQYLKEQIEKETQEGIWLAELEIAYQKVYKFLLPDLKITSKCYFESEGRTPREYLEHLLQNI